MLRKSFLWTVLLGLLSLTTLSKEGQGQATVFEKIHGREGKDSPFDLLRTYGEGYLVAGGSANFGSNTQAFLLAVDSVGDHLWRKGYGGNGVERFHAVSRTLDSAYVAAGISNSNPNGDYQILLTKTDRQGNKTWSSMYGGTDWEKLSSVKPLPDSGYVLGGSTYSFSKGGSDLFVVRVDENGDTVWTDTYGSKGHEELHELALSQDSSEYILVGERADTGSSDTVRGSVIRLDSAGNVLTERTHSLGYQTRFRSVLEESNGQLTMVANIRSDSGLDTDISLLRYDTGGNQLWKRDMAEPLEDKGMKVMKTQDGGYLLAAHTNSVGNGEWDIWLHKRDGGGFFEWATTYGGSEEERTFCGIATEDSGFATAALTRSYGDSQKNIYLLKTDSTGNSSGNVVIGLDDKKEKGISRERRINVYPNPVDRELKLHFPPGIRKGKVGLRIRSLQGRILVDRSLASERSFYRILTEQLPQGIHILSLYREGQRTFRKKLIIRH